MFLLGTVLKNLVDSLTITHRKSQSPVLLIFYLADRICLFQNCSMYTNGFKAMFFDS